MKRSIQTGIRVFISFGLLALLGYLFRAQLGLSLLVICNSDPRFLFLAFLTYIVFIFISAWRWQILLLAQGLRFSTLYLARIFTLGLFFCKLLPTSIGGDVMRIAYTVQPGKGPEAFSATFLDRLIGFESLSFLAVLMALLLTLSGTGKLNIGAINLSPAGVILILSGIFVLLLLITAVFFNDACHQIARRLLLRLPRRLQRLTATVDRAYEAVKRYRHQPVALILSFLSGIGVQAALALAWFFCAAAVRATVPLGYYFVFIPILNIVVNIPTIGGLGVREAAFVAFFTPNWLAGHLNPEQALAVAFLFLALDLVFALLGGLFFAFTPRRVKPEEMPKEV